MAGRLETYEGVEANLWREQERKDATEGAIYPLSTLRLGLKMMRTQMEWCDETIQQLESGQGARGGAQDGL